MRPKDQFFMGIVPVHALQYAWVVVTMMTSSNGIILLALCAGNLPLAGEFSPQRPVTRSFDVFFDLRLNKRLSKHAYYDVTVMSPAVRLAPL